MAKSAKEAVFNQRIKNQTAPSPKTPAETMPIPRLDISSGVR